MLSPNQVNAVATVAVALAIHSPLDANEPSSQFCTQLQAVVRAADTEFRSIRGQAIETSLRNTERWETTSHLPGASSCSISISERRSGRRASYNCNWRVADDSGLDQQYETFAAAVPACFPGVPPRISDEQASEFRPGELNPASTRFRFPGGVSLSIRKWTEATTSTRSHISFTVTRLDQ